jgi:predicted HNH restriction endonuclease
MKTEKQNFIEWQRTNKRNSLYTRETYASIIADENKILWDLKNILRLKVNSLYEITDPKKLKNIFDKWYSVDKVVVEDQRIHNKNSCAFEMYINYRKNSQELTFTNETEFVEKEARTEGGERVVVSKVAERDPKLRQIAIRLHGLKCKACGFDFFKTYGEIGKGFIEIHHIRQLKNNENFNETLTDPKTDLTPLCSNCHRVVHRKKHIVLSMEELQKILKKKKK